eukprot:6278395-Alexandrium_andersonii.AAC.1
MLRDAGAASARVWRAGAAASAAFGAAITGCSWGRLQQLRAQEAELVASRVPLRSTTITLMVGGQEEADPLFQYILAPLVAWARQVWKARRNAQQLRMMAVAFDGACRHACDAQRDTLTGRGPASATVQALGRLGWEPKGATKWVTQLP